MDRVANRLRRRLCELPPGFHWMAPRLFDREIGFGGDETAGASFLRRDGTVWTTGPDGIVANLLAAELTAVTGRDPGEHYRELVQELGTPVYARVDVTATLEDRQKLAALASSAVKESTLAEEPITAKLTYAPCNGVAFGGLKVITANGWFAARPSGSEDLYRIHAESFRGREHLDAIVYQAREIVGRALGAPA
jgi:phosphoglucomutase